VDTQMQRLVRNTEQFLEGRPANNVLMSGARGTGKSSLVKALLHEYAACGLRLIEVDKTDLVSLPSLLTLLEKRPEKFIVFCDDLSFESGEDTYKALKTALDGGLSQRCDNVLVYATSNRRHLMPEYMDENQATTGIRGEVQPKEAVEEKVSLSDRFGLWLSFYPFDQNDYLQAVENWLADFGLPLDDTARHAALNWSLMRGSRSGRIAWQFACDWAGRLPGQRVVD
jgi:predicted AAA+ superfamily ATPase